MVFRLGIDTGGTFTDAVLVDGQQKIVAAFKSLTSRYDLTIGIGNALCGCLLKCRAGTLPAGPERRHRHRDRSVTLLHRHEIQCRPLR